MARTALSVYETKIKGTVDNDKRITTGVKPTDKAALALACVLTSVHPLDRALCLFVLLPRTLFSAGWLCKLILAAMLTYSIDLYYIRPSRLHWIFVSLQCSLWRKSKSCSKKKNLNINAHALILKAPVLEKKLNHPLVVVKSLMEKRLTCFLEVATSFVD